MNSTQLSNPSLATLLPAIGVAALRRMRSRLVGAGGNSATDSASRYLAEQRVGIMRALRQAARRSFGALEIAFQSGALRIQLATMLPLELRESFLEQARLLHETFVAAGLDDTEDCAFFLREVRILATARDVPLEMRDVFARSNPLVETEAGADHVEELELESYGEELKHAGEPLAARLVSVRANHGNSLAVSLVDYFLCRALQTDEIGGGEFVFVHVEPTEDLWPHHDLGVLAGVVESQADPIEAILEREADTDETATKTPADAEDEALDTHFQTGFEYYQAADYERAIVHFTAALRIDPTSFPLLAYRGDAHRLLCAHDRAIADYSAALTQNPVSAPVLVQRSTSYRLHGDLARAVDDANTAISLDPTHVPAYLARADAHAARGEFERTIGDYTHAIQHQPDSFWAFFGRGKAHQQKDRLDAAIADFTQVLLLNPNYALALLHRGETSSRKGELDRALIDYTEFLRHHPRNQLAYRSRAQIYERKKEPERALADYNSALRLDPKDAIALLGRAILLRRSGKLKRAHADLSEVVRLAPNTSAAYYHRGLIHLAQSNFTEALADFNLALDRDSGLIGGYLGRALVHDRLGRYLDGIQNCGRAMQLEGQFAPAHLLRGMLCSHAGKYDKAILDLTRAIEFDPNFAQSFQERGMAYMLAGDLTRAAADFSRLIELHSDRALAYVARGTVRQMQGENDAAIADFGAALQLDPKSILTGWHQTLADQARGLTTQLLMDYIEGISPKVEKSPAVKRRTLLRPQAKADDSNTTPSAPESTRLPKAQPRAETTTVQGTSPAAETLQHSTLAPDSAPTQIALPVMTQSEIPGMPVAAEPVLSEEVPATNAEGEAEAPENVELTLDDVEVVDNAAVTEEAAAAFLETTVEESATSDVPPAPVPTSPLPPMLCPVCRQNAAPYKKLPDLRVQCGKCQAVFIPDGTAPRPMAAAAAARNSAKSKAVKPKNSDLDDDDARFTRNQKIAFSAGGVSVLMILLYLFFPTVDASGDGPPVAGRVSAEQLLKEFSVNRVEAAKKYSAGQIVVSGEVAEIIKDKRPRIRFKATGHPKVAIEAIFSHVNDMKDIQKDKTITVRGECDGWQKRVVEISLCKVVASDRIAPSTSKETGRQKNRAAYAAGRLILQRLLK